METSSLVKLQQRFARWVETRLSRQSLYDFHERARKSVEESVELAQAVGLTQADVLRIVMYVYKQPAGEVKQELTGVFLTSLAMATALGVDLETLASYEIGRVEELSQDYIDGKQIIKHAAGVCAYGGRQ